MPGLLDALADSMVEATPAAPNQNSKIPPVFTGRLDQPFYDRAEKSAGPTRRLDKNH